MTSKPFANRLITETSPYLRQHAHNPVDWHPWGDEALDKSRREDKPIFLSIGYAACHWCHVMERESFMDEGIASFLNEHFVSIKVDREERPDIDNIYMGAVVLMTGQGGWPTSVFLTPELEPFYGGTYFPPVPRHGLPAFLDVLQAVQKTWRQNRQNILSSAAGIAARIKQNNLLSIPSGELPAEDPLEAARDELIAAYDWRNGGWGRAPKFPQPMLLEFLCLQAARGHRQSFDVVRHNLDAMQRGGIFDLVGGGFHRYSTDARWLVPHFEKMLYDNAQLAFIYLHAYLLSGEQSYRHTCESCLDFISRELTDPSGGFASSLDADTDGEEGTFYLWTRDELNRLLSGEQIALLEAVCDLPAEGNFEGKVILQLRAGRADLASALNFPLEEFSASLDDIFAALFSARTNRKRPLTDDKVLTSWNALTLRAFAEAARYLGRRDYLGAAQTNAGFLLAGLRKPDGLYRSWRAGEVRQPAFLEDYAALVTALLTLYQVDFDQIWYSAAGSLLEDMLQRFTDPEGGFFDTQAATDNLLYRPKEIQDNTVPSGNALAAYALLLYNAFSERSNLRVTAEQQLERIKPLIHRYPGAFGYWLQALDLARGPLRQIALISPPTVNSTSPLVDYLQKTYLPRTVLAAGSTPLNQGAPALLHDRPSVGGLPTAYLCEDFVCQLPVTRLEDLLAQLSSPSR